MKNLKNLMIVSGLCLLAFKTSAMADTPSQLILNCVSTATQVTPITVQINGVLALKDSEKYKAGNGVLDILKINNDVAKEIPLEATLFSDFALIQFLLPGRPLQNLMIPYDYLNYSSLDLDYGDPKLSESVFMDCSKSVLK